MFRSRAIRLLPLGVIVFIPVGLAEAIPVDIDVDEVSVLEGLGLFAWFLAEVAVTFAGLIFYGAVAGSMMVEHLRGEHMPISGLARELPYGRLIAINLILIFGSALGLALLVLPGLALLVVFSVAPPAAGIEHRGVRAAFRRSRDLVHGHFRTVSAVILPTWVATIALAAAFGAVGAALPGPDVTHAWLAATLTLVFTAPMVAMARAYFLVALAAERDRM